MVQPGGARVANYLHELRITCERTNALSVTRAGSNRIPAMQARRPIGLVSNEKSEAQNARKGPVAQPTSCWRPRNLARALETAFKFRRFYRINGVHAENKMELRQASLAPPCTPKDFLGSLGLPVEAGAQGLDLVAQPPSPATQWYFKAFIYRVS